MISHLRQNCSAIKNLRPCGFVGSHLRKELTFTSSHPRKDRGKNPLGSLQECLNKYVRRKNYDKYASDVLQGKLLLLGTTMRAICSA